MATIAGTYIPSVDTGNEKINTLINVMIFPTLMEFEQIIINYETGKIIGDNLVNFTYSNWNPDYPVELHLNGGKRGLNPSLFTCDYTMGKITLNTPLEPGDNVQATYCFNYFPLVVLEGFIQRAVIVANTAGNGQTLNYTIDNVPDGWLGIIADIVVSMCMEKLILEYDLWKGRLIFGISANNLYDGNDNIVAQLETVKKNAEERAYMSLNNPKLRAPNLLEGPTQYYYEALLVGSSSRYKNGSMSYGPLRGAKFNRLVGSVPRQ